jgi:TolB-like protein
VLLAGYFIFNFTTFGKKFHPAPFDQSIAVLPFVNMSNDQDQEYFSDGITEEITSRLSKISGLRVKSRTSVLQYKNQTKTAKLIAQELAVNNILEGSVRKQGSKVLITAQLINGETDEHIWSETYNRELKDIFEVQSDIAQQIARKFQTKLSVATLKKLVTPPTLNTEAYDLYLKASTLSSLEAPVRGGRQPNRQKAIMLLKQAIQLDPSFSDAYALLSKNYTLYGTDAENPKLWLDSATTLARKATTISPDRERGYIAMANVKYWEGNYDESLQWLLKAHETTPFSTVRNITDNYLERNDYGKAFEWVMKGMEYDRAEPAYYVSEALLYFKLGLLDSMKNCIDRARRINSESSGQDYPAFLYYLFTGNYQEYKNLTKKFSILDEKEYALSMGILYLFQRDWMKADSCYAISSLPDEIDAGLVNIQLGKKERGRLFLEKAIQTRIRFLGFNDAWHNYDISRAYAALQDKRYIDYFNKTLERGWHYYPWIDQDPFFDLVRKTPEFKKLRQKVYERNEGFKSDLYKHIKRYYEEKNN